MQNPVINRNRLQRLPALAAGIALGAALGWLAFFVLPDALAGDSAPSVGQIPTLPPAPAAGLRGLAQGAQAPPFDLQTVQGESWALDAQRGQVVLLNFWATWCAPCRTEMPLLQAAADRHAEAGLLVVGVNFDETAEQVGAFAAELELEFPQLLDPGGVVQELYGVRGYPTTAVIDREGRMAAYHIGVLTSEQLEGYLTGAGLFE